jgi:G3E family GTPase
MTGERDLTPVNVLTGFLGSGKTTLLQRMLRSPALARTAVLINELGEVGLDHLLVQPVDDAVVLLESGCICCTIRGDLSAALRGLLGRRERGEIPAFDRVVIETTGLADPGPILYTLLSEPVLKHHFRLGNVITTVDAVNAPLHLSANPEGVQQVAAADRLIVTKTDLAAAEQTAQVRDTLARLNPSAEVWMAADATLDIDALLDVRPPARPGVQPGGAGATPSGKTVGARDHHDGFGAHARDVGSVSLVLDTPLDWTAFGIWLSLLLNRHGNDVLRVKGILALHGVAAPVFVNGVQHIVHPPQHLDRWPSDDHRSRLVFITRGIDRARLLRSLEAFCGTKAVEHALA